MNNFKTARKAQNFTQDYVGERLSITSATISRYENGIMQPDNDTLKKMAKLYQCTVDYLLGMEYGVGKRLNQGTKIPILRRVIAGVPLEAIENIDGYEEITMALASRGEYFGLKVKGLSMYPYYLEGDIVIVRKQETAEDGDIAIVMINGNEATIKKIQKKSTGITLSAFNPMIYEPHFYSIEEINTLPLRIAGIVVESRRSESNHIKPHI